jgi:hypothetical protein
MFVACGGTGGGCTGCLTPLAAPYDGPKTNNAVTAKISGAGFDFINTNWTVLLSQLTTNPINIPVPCSVTNLPVIGDINLCDQNLNNQCDPGESCNSVTVKIDNFAINPEAGATNKGVLTGTATLEISTGDIFISTVSTSAGVCLGLSDLECHVNFDTARNPPATQAITITLNFTLDSRRDSAHPQLNFDVGSIQGLANLDVADLDLTHDNTCGYECSAVDFLTSTIPALFNYIIGLLEPTLDNKIYAAINAAKCLKCGTGLAACPGSSSCDSASGTCMSSGSCLPIDFGISGESHPGTLLGAYGVAPDVALDLYAVAGGSVTSVAQGQPKSGLQLGVVAGGASKSGTAPDYLSPCVPDIASPIGGAPPAPDFDAAAGAAGYQVGLGISSTFLNQASWAAHRSGTMCLSVSGNNIQLLNTGLFKTFLPSLGLVAGSDTQDAPMLVNIRPLTPPQIDIGLGTFDPATQKPLEPLLTVTLDNTIIDIYALIDERWTRLFTLAVDIKLPLSLIIEGCPQGVTPALGDLKQLITVSRAPYNSEILAEDPAVLQGLIPAVISLAQPALASALKPIAVPNVQGFAIKIDALKGISQQGSTPNYDDLGLFGEIKLAGQCDSAMVHTTAELVERHLPTRDALSAKGGKLEWPVAMIRAGSPGSTVPVEYGYEVDDGLWSTFFTGPMIEVTDPALLIEGHHRISIRARPSGGKGISDPNPAVVDFLVDYDAPTVKLVAHAAEGTMDVLAKDNVSGPQSLRYRYTVGDEAASDFGPARPIDLVAVNQAGKLVVEVQDEAGNVGRSVYRAPLATETSGLTPGLGKGASPKPGSPDGRGCGSTGADLSLLSLGALLLRRRRA